MSSHGQEQRNKLEKDLEVLARISGGELAKVNKRLVESIQSVTAHLHTTENLILGMARLLKIKPKDLAQIVADEAINKKYEADVIQELQRIGARIKEEKEHEAS